MTTDTATAEPESAAEPELASPRPSRFTVEIRDGRVLSAAGLLIEGHSFPGFLMIASADRVELLVPMTEIIVVAAEPDTAEWQITESTRSFTDRIVVTYAGGTAREYRSSELSGLPCHKSITLSLLGDVVLSPADTDPA